MAEGSKGKGVIKFLVWLVVSLGLFYYAFHSYNTGMLTSWYYYQAATDGYAIRAQTFRDASKEKPARLEIGSFERIEGLQAVPVKKGDRLPVNANGIISAEVLKKGKRAMVEDKFIKVTMPVEIKDARGFKFKDSFMHKGIQTNPWSGAWNVVLVALLGLSLGLLAEGFTDMMGLKLTKIEHFEGAH